MSNGGIKGPKNAPETANNYGVWDVEETQQAVATNVWKSSPVQDGLVLHLDATNPASYTAGSTTWYDLSPTKLNFTGTASFMSTTTGLSSGTGSAWASAVTGLLNNDSHSIFFNIRFNTNTTYPQSTSGNWEKVFTYAPAGTDRAPGIWRFPDARWLHWRYDPTNTGPNIGGSGAANNEATNPSEDFVGDTWYYVGVTKSGSTGAIYINGQPAGTWTLPATKTAGTSAITLFEGYTFASANIDNVQVYSRPITAVEVLTNYKASQSRLTNIQAAFLVVGGGGGGGMDMGGGGGAGGFVSGNRTLVRGATYGVTVGAGGAGGPAGNTPGQGTGHQFQISAKNGGDSILMDPIGGAIYGKGGGYGGSSYFGYTPNQGYGAAGGSGGGASGYSDGNSGRKGAANQFSTYGYGLGKDGGNNGGQYYSGGGGGAGVAGNGSTGSVQADGGAGVRNQILGTDYYWAGGGGGAGHSREGGNGGIGGGGAGAVGTKTGGYGLNNGVSKSGGSTNSQAQVPGGDGGANTGGGGGGGSHYNATNQGGNGGSGIVVLRYPEYYPDLVNITGLTWAKVTVPGYKIYKFTEGAGYFTVPEVEKPETSIVKTSLQMYLDASSPASYTAGSTTWYDLSGNANHATIYGTSAYSSAAGGSLAFDGTTTYAKAPGTLSLHPAITVCGLINFGIPKGVGYERFIDMGSGTPLNNLIVYREGTSNNLGWYLDNNGTNVLNHVLPGAIQNNTWVFMSFTYDGTTSRIGINGRYYTASVSGTIPNVTRTNNYIGRSNWNDDFFDTGMQSVMVYNRALTEAETTQNYLAFRNRVTETTYAADPNAQYLKLAIPFSDEQGIRDQSAAIRGSGTSFATYAVNGATVNRDIAGKFYGPSLALTPYTRKAHVAVQNNPNLWLTNQDFTIEGWWYFAANNVGYQNLASHSGDTGDQQSGWVLYLEGNNTLNFIGSQGWALGVGSSTVPTTGTWHHVAASRSNNTTRLFLNGTQIGSSTQVVNIVSPTSQTLRIGDYQWFPGGERGFSGYIQDFRLYVGVGKYTGTFTPPTQMRL